VSHRCRNGPSLIEGGAPAIWRHSIVIRFLVRVFVPFEDGGEGVGGGEDFWRESEEAVEGSAAFGGFSQIQTRSGRGASYLLRRP